jgi:hypothetical protein
MTVPKSSTCVTLDRGPAGGDVDGDLADMTAIGEGMERRLPGCMAGKPALADAARHIAERDGLVGADDAVTALGEGDVGRSRLQQLRHQRQPVGGDIGGRPSHRDASDRYRARPAGAAPGGDECGIALDGVEGVKRHAQGIGQNLRVGRGMALPVALRADEKLDAAVAPDLDPRGLVAAPARCSM